MMTKVEDVAKAIAARDLDEGDGFYDWFALTEEVTDKYLAMARAAIEAMNVDSAVRVAVTTALKTYVQLTGDPDPAALQAAIDAALSHEGK